MPCKINAFKMTFGDDSGCQGLRRPVGEFIDKGVLSGQNHGQPGLGVFFKLTDGMQFGKDLQAHQRRLIDNQHDFHFFLTDQIRDFFFNHLTITALELLEKAYPAHRQTAGKIP